MKVVWFSLVCAVVVGCVDAGAALARSLLPLHPGQGFAYSTSTQYLNTVPVYQFGLRPQLAYHYPQLTQLSPVSPIHGTYQGYYPVSFFPSSPVYYPAPIAPAPIQPGVPVGSPSFPSQPAPAPQPAGDADTSVVDAAESGERPQYQDDESSKQQDSQSQQAQPPPSTFPSFPQFPQLIGQQPSFPQLPQFPQQFPQFPPGSIPSFPQFPQQPSSTPPSFPAADGADKGLNDEDTISVESA